MSQEHKESLVQRLEAKIRYVMGKNNVRRIQQRLSALTNSGRVLELGCRSGIYTACLLEQAVSITATDPSDEWLTVVSSRFQHDNKVKVEKVSCFFLPYQDHTFDTIVISHLLHQIPNQERALMELRRVLKPNGRLYIISDTCYDMTLWTRCQLHLRHLIAHHKRLHYSVHLTPSLTESLCRAAGFNEVQCQLLGHRTKVLFALAETT